MDSAARQIEHIHPDCLKLHELNKDVKFEQIGNAAHNIICRYGELHARKTNNRHVYAPLLKVALDQTAVILNSIVQLQNSGSAYVDKTAMVQSSLEALNNVDQQLVHALHKIDGDDAIALSVTAGRLAESMIYRK